MSPVFEAFSMPQLTPDDQLQRATDFRDEIRRRRSVRQFSSEPVSFEVIERAIEAACSAPSGANRQPWQFVVVGDPDVKRRIRDAAEAEERENYERRFPKDWLDDLAPFGTDWHKEFLENAPYLIAVFRIDYGLERSSEGHRKSKHYYVSESVGIACGFLLAALHLAGLATLTHTPSPVGFLREILGRARHERPYLLIPVGYPAGEAMVPVISKKPLAEVMSQV